MSSIFSTYSTGENRVTASVLAVLRSLSLERIERLLGALLEQSEFELVRFQNQPSKGGKGVPDAIIHASIRLLVETKIERNAINVPQLKQHLKRLDDANEATKLLLVITPDVARPDALEAVNDERMVWASFASLDQAIDEILGDKYEVTSEREAFLLRELQNMLSAEGLLASSTDVVVVAARNAWPEYNQIHAYVCQPNRPFQQVNRVAFYSKGMIHPLVPKILHAQDAHENVVMTAGQYEGPLGELVHRIITEQRREEGERFKVLLLSAPDSPDTLRLPTAIPNDAKSKTGKPTAFTMSQRYISSERLWTAKTTSDLV
jgi:Restriction endonuclease